ncbi:MULTISPECIES: hypothetical protein [unclassified Streptomyces]|uniref:hypothetical protein n=1 Tax=unclassified Streptomyces TaxID=2593676 RepID=UPI0019089FC4|nr:hypothetical protein [Streptomyces sp. HSG2]
MTGWWIELRRTPARWVAPPLLAVGLAMVFLVDGDWRGSWPETSAAATRATHGGRDDREPLAVVRQRAGGLDTGTAQGRRGPGGVAGRACRTVSSYGAFGDTSGRDEARAVLRLPEEEQREGAREWVRGVGAPC